jgi:beta-lactamase class D
LRSFILSLAILINGTFAFAAPQDPYFKNMDGCFLLYNMKAGVFEKVVGEERCRQRFSPCSTFKIPLAVMVFDAGILKDAHALLKWDGNKDTREVANHDHDARSWMQDSIVWFSKRLTPQLGPERLTEYLRAFHYGNEDMSAGIARAWLMAPDDEGPALKISAYEQVEFIKALWAGKLQASERSLRITRDITWLEASPKGFRLSGKTGSNIYTDKRRLGWFVAHIDNGIQEYIAITNFSDISPTDEALAGGLKAKEITKKILADQGLW